MCCHHGGGGGGWTQSQCDPPLTYLSTTPGVSGGGGGRVEGPGPPRVVILKHAEMDARATRGVCNDYGAQCTSSCVIAPFLLQSLSYIKPTRIFAHAHSLSFACLHFIFALPFAHFSLTTALCTCLCCATSAGVGTVYRGAPSSVHVVDPGNRSGKIGCPLHLVFENAGLHHYYNNYLRGYHPSLCMKFQAGQCNHGKFCNQIHADQNYVAKLRKAAADGRNCCLGHGDWSSEDPKYLARLSSATAFIVVIPQRFEGRKEVRKFVVLKYQIARTKASERLLASNGHSLHVASVCANHQKQCCHWGKDCTHIHICRKVWQMWRNLPMFANGGDGQVSASDTKSIAEADAAVLRCTRS